MAKTSKKSADFMRVRELIFVYSYSYSCSSLFVIFIPSCRPGLCRLFFARRGDEGAEALRGVPHHHPRQRGQRSPDVAGRGLQHHGHAGAQGPRHGRWLPGRAQGLGLPREPSRRHSCPCPRWKEGGRAGRQEEGGRREEGGHPRCCGILFVFFELICRVQRGS